MKKIIIIALMVMTLNAYTKPLKVYILAGQSNMQGHAHVSTFEHMAMDPESAKILKEIQGPDGKPRVFDNIYISSIGSSAEEKSGKLTVGYGADKRGPKIGPELTFGIYMQKHVKEPILIIKTAWGGKSLWGDFRPPSAGDLGPEKEKETPGLYYKQMIAHVNKVLSNIKAVYPNYKASDGYSIEGFVWFQGWNDMVDRGVYPQRDKEGGYDLYTKLLTVFIKDVRKDLKAPDMKFVIGVMGVGGVHSKTPPNRYKGIHKNFRDAMAAPAAMPEFKDNVRAVLTEKYWDHELAELNGRKGKIKAKEKELKKAGKSNEEIKAAMEKFRSELYTKEELEKLSKGVSNFEFHYMGSSKVLTGIGKAFAEAMIELEK